MLPTFDPVVEKAIDRANLWKDNLVETVLPMGCYKW